VDEAAEREFAEYFRARREAVRRTAYLLCGDWHRADDHAQAAFVALHRHWRRIRDRPALDAWVRRTLVRKVVYESRRPWRRERAVPAPVQDAAAREGTDAATRHVLVDGLRALPPGQRAAHPGVERVAVADAPPVPVQGDERGLGVVVGAVPVAAEQVGGAAHGVAARAEVLRELAFAGLVHAAVLSCGPSPFRRARPAARCKNLPGSPGRRNTVTDP